MIVNSCVDIVQAFADQKSKLELQLKIETANISSIDSEISDILHIIEYVDLPANKMSKLIKQLKTCYKSRRVSKENRNILHNILHNNKEGYAELKTSALRVARYEEESIKSLNRLSKI